MHRFVSQRDKYHNLRFNFYYFSVYDQTHRGITYHSALLLFIEARLQRSRFTRHIFEHVEYVCVRTYARSRGKMQRAREFVQIRYPGEKKHDLEYTRWIGYEDLRGEIRALCGNNGVIEYEQRGTETQMIR